MGKVNQPTDVNSKLREHDRQIAELNKRVGLSSAVISRGGLRIINEGELVMVDENETVIFKIGQVNFGAGTSYGMRLNFDNGNPAMLLGGTPGDQAWALYDENNNYLVTNDAASGYGLARPYLNYRLVPAFDAEISGTILVPSTAAASATRLWQGTTPMFHPKLTIGVTRVGSGAGTTGHWRLDIDGQTVLADETTSGVRTVSIPGWGTDILPAHDVSIEVYGWVTGGAGRTWVSVDRLYGVQS